MRLTTPSLETHPTPQPRSPELPFRFCSKPGSSKMTASSGDAIQRTSRPGPTSRNVSPLPTKNGRSCRQPKPAAFYSRETMPISWSTTPTKTKLSKPSKIYQQPLPLIAPQSQLSLEPTVHSPQTALPPTPSSSSPCRTS